MRILVVASMNDNRHRWKNITEPLSFLGHNVELIMIGSVCKNYSAILRILRMRDPGQIIIFIGCGPSMLPLLLACRLRRLIVVVRLGGNAFPPVFKVLEIPVYLQVKNFLFRKVKTVPSYLFLKMNSRYIVVNESIMGEMKRYIPKKSFWYVVNQYQSGFFPAERELASQVKRILTVTNLNNLNKAYGVMDIIDMLEGFCYDNQTELELLIAGSGIYDYRLKNAVNRMSKSSYLKISQIGFCKNVDNLHENADVFVYNSADDATPNALIEAKRLGTPVLVNDFAPLKSLVVDGESGLVFDSYAEFKKKLETLMHSKSLRQRLAARGRRDFDEKFTMLAVADQLESALIGLRESNASR